MRIEIAERLEGVAPGDWNALKGANDSPFLRHEFLAGLERFGCVGPQWGWLPQHVLAWDGDRLAGAVPLYLKHNSYGEFVFDWSWADAYQHARLPYYPKLVSSVPYTPATGARLLLASDAPKETGEQLINGARELAQRVGASSLHWLFPTTEDMERLTGTGFLRRTGTQFHWFNRGYRDFDDYLERFSAEKRKKVKRERRRVAEQGVEVDVLHGGEVTDSQWETFHRFYESTFDKLGGYATFTADFFKYAGETLGDKVVLVLARHQGRYVAGALNYRSGDTLYGRHWGCDEEFHSLHFEACYYTGLDYCMRHGLSRFEPGAQGEHKVSRGFEPVTTWSAHWLANPVFAHAVGDYLRHEHEAVEEYMAEWRGHLPYKRRAFEERP